MTTSPRQLLRPVPDPPAPRIVAFDVFILVNLALFACMCVFTYYARFVAYRGAANLWEFFVYAAVIVLVIVVGWASLRRSAFSGHILLLIQAGIMAHFAGAFVHWDGLRLYDHAWLGVRYDKAVHLVNAFAAARGMAHVCERRGVRVTGLVRLLLGLSVLGLGAIVEVVEYLVMLTIPDNGVGGYDNNMQDLIANGVGAAISMATLDDGARRFSVVAPVRDASVGRPLLSALEIVTLTCGTLGAVWLGPVLLSRAGYAGAGTSLMFCGFVYCVWLSPVRLHGDSLAIRGLGPSERWFIRGDNLRAACRSFVILTLAGAVAILFLAEWRNPGWAARANWQAWAVRLVFYAASAYLQGLVFVGFLLVRLREVFAQRITVALGAAVIFGALHAPDPLLVMLTTTFAFATAWISVATPNVLAAAGCQFVLGFLVHRTLELPLRAGYFYTHPDYYLFRELLPPLRRLMQGLY